MSPTNDIRVLLVDGNEDGFPALGDALGALHGEGFSTVLVTDVNTASNELGENPYDLAIATILPDENAALSWVRRTVDAGCTAPLLLIGPLEPGSGQRAEAAGATAFIAHEDVNARVLSRLLMDVVEKRRLWGRVRDGDHRFHAVMENLREGLVMTDLEGTILFVNQAMVDLTGYTHSEMENAGYASLLLPREARFLDQQMLQRRTQGLTDLYDQRLLKKNGDTVWARIHASPHRDTEGRIVGVVANHADLSSRHEAERALEASDRRLRTIFDSAAIGMLSLDAQGKIVQSNRRVQSLFGKGAEELRGRTRQSLLCEEDRPLAAKGFAKVAHREEDQLQTELRYMGPGNTPIWVRETMSRVEGAHEREDFCIAFLEDITGHKEMEEELRLSQRMEAVGKLSGGIAHSFNNLLTIIMGRSGLMLKRRDLPRTLRREIQILRQTADRASQLTRQLLAFSRKQVLVPEVMDVSHVVDEMQAMIRPLVREDIVLYFDLSHDLGAVKADRAQIEQVLMNLVVNARDAMPTGGKLVIETCETQLDEDYVRTHPGIAAGPYVQLSVTDTGTGMEPDVRLRIFEPFFTTKPKGWGTGLGLSTVYGTVAQSGGSIWVYSEPGRGTTFKIFLPIVPAGEAYRAPEQSDAVEGETSARTDRGEECILVVEDEDAVREVACDILRSRGYEILDAPGGVEALEICRSHPGKIDLMLSDVVMPQIGGPELLGLVRKIRPGLKVLFTSGYPDRGVVRSGMIEASTPFLQKPYSTEALSQMVRQILDDRDTPGKMAIEA